jgi:hypothetical protein
LTRDSAPRLTLRRDWHKVLHPVELLLCP